MQGESDLHDRVENEAGSGRTSLVLAASQIEFLERLCARVRRDTGARLTKAMLIRELVAALDDAGIPFSGVRSEAHLREWLRGTIGAAPLADPAASRRAGSRA